MRKVSPIVANGRFVNPAFVPGHPWADPGRVPEHASFREFVKWRRERAPPPKTFHVPRADPAPARLPDPPERGVRATWVGHSTVVLQIDGSTLVTDPVWSDRIAHGVMKRRTAPGLPFTALPRVDGILQSHNHYDHLDSGTMRRFPRGTPVFAPTGVGAWFRKRGWTNVTERSWWESAPLGSHTITCVPAQHFSGRSMRDRDATLWSGWMIEGARGTRVWFAGDSGYFAGFRDIGAAFPDVDLALVPVGAYLPRWFMSPVHVDPAEAVQAFLDVGAKSMLPIHWGTFRLSDEPIDAPPGELLRIWDERKLEPERLLIPALGETKTF